LTMLGLTRTQGAQIEGQMVFEGEDLVAMSDDKLRRIRGNEIAMIFQDPLSSLHPFYKVGKQLTEAMRVHRDISKAAARERAVELLALVGIPDPDRRVDQHPHEFSGGMRQRAMIAMALANEPKLLIADEPTTALDVTVQRQILDLLDQQRRELELALLFITHDLAVVASVADRVAVMYAGRMVEEGPTREVLSRPRHPYTQGLLAASPTLAKRQLTPIPGSVPQLTELPRGCAFAPRCSFRRIECDRAVPELRLVEPEHYARCVLV